MKFRIKQISRTDPRYPTFFQIQVKCWYGWKDVDQVEIDAKEIKWDTYESAEQYMINTYMKYDGQYEKNGNVYTYTKFTYGY